MALYHWHVSSMFAGELLHNSYVKHKIGKADTEQGMISDQWETSWFSPTLLGWEVVNVFPRTYVIFLQHTNIYTASKIYSYTLIRLFSSCLFFFLITPKRVAEDYTETEDKLRRSGAMGRGASRVLCQVASVVSDSLRPFGLQPTRLLCPWDSPGKITAAGCHVLLLGIFPNQSASNILFLGLNGGYLEVSLLKWTYTLGTFLNTPNKEEEKLRLLPNVMAFRYFRQSRFKLWRVRASDYIIS